MNWEGFSEAAPELAAIGRERLDQTRLCLVGTLRSDGSPRISPCEVTVVDGELALGMMWRSHKARDLLRDPRIVVHSTQCDREAKEGDFKLYGRAVDRPDPTFRLHYADEVEAAIDWRPEEPYHLFAVDIESAGFISFGQERTAMRWDRARGFARIPHPDEGAPSDGEGEAT